MRALFIAIALVAVISTGTSGWTAEPLGEPYGALVYASSGSSANQWLYTASNISYDQGYAIWLLQIEVDEDTNIISVGSPLGWTANLDVPHLIMWQSTSQKLSGGQLLSGFKAKLDHQPQFQNWTAMFEHVENSGDIRVDYGSVASTPEPSSMVAMMVAVTSLAGVVFRSKGRS